MLKFSEILNFLGKIPILKELEWFEWFEWFGPSPIEPFNSASNDRDFARRVRGEARREAEQERRPQHGRHPSRARESGSSVPS